MNNRGTLSGSHESAASRFQFLHPGRDLQSNWEVDLAKNLEDYLLKVCSGEISTDQDQELHSVNFAEAALLLQGSVQVYSRKVEYLYSLVLHVLEFLSQQRQQLEETNSSQPDENEENELFLALDDVPVDAKNCLDDELDKNDSSKQCIKLPANLVVLEGNCLDSSGYGSELERYLLVTCNFYGDFLLLDPSDAEAVYVFSTTYDSGTNCIVVDDTGISARSKIYDSPFNSPTKRSGGASHGKNQGIELNKISENNCTFETNNTQFSGLQGNYVHSEHEKCQLDEPDFGFSTPMDEFDNDDDDPWKPLNPHEQGNLKIKPFKRIKKFGRNAIHYTRRNTQAFRFPIAKLDGIDGSEFADSFEVHQSLKESQRLSSYEKLRKTLTFGEEEKNERYCDFVDDDDEENELNNNPPDFSQEQIDLQNRVYDTDVPFCNRQGDTAATSDAAEAFAHDNLDSNASLEDLCRFHLDVLLANIAETQKQTELAARVSAWKQRVESTLEEQEARPHFDIHLYGERILEKVYKEADNEGYISFSNIVNGQPKHEIARTFSALLQLVNNGNVDLQKAQASEELICHTAANPFYIRLCDKYDRREEKQHHAARKRVKSPYRKGCHQSCSTLDANSPLDSADKNGRFSVRLGKACIIRLTPNRKRRRRSANHMEPLDLQSAG
ncbi:condensin-2 complex subunit H2-like [Curcuma longa]|uniref:condensin-2 complex subunit H2-like n=1 Tax=Curcuma longa TaxID=136217 RepID=UPI003D9F59B7